VLTDVGHGLLLQTFYLQVGDSYGAVHYFLLESELFSDKIQVE